MAYIVDPTDPTQPTGDKGATQGDDELRALKGLVQTLFGGSAIAPVNVFRKNAIIGGDFDINPFQRGSNFAAVASGTYIADRFQYFNTSGAVITASKTADSPVVTTVYKNKTMDNFSQNCLQLNVTTADVAIGAGEFVELRYTMEGIFWKQLAQVPITLSFWHKHTKAGIYSVGFRNTGNDRSYIAEYTQVVSNVWEFDQIVIPASPAAGTWAYTTNVVGLKVSFMMACSGTLATAPNVWTAGNFIASPNQVNGLDTIGNNFNIAQIQLEVGAAASKFELRDFERELALCQRYYEKSFQLSTVPAQNVGINTGASDFIAGRAGALVSYGIVEYAVRKARLGANPIFYNPSAANAQARDLISGTDCSLTGAFTFTEHGFTVQTTGNAATAVGNALSVHWTADADF